MAAATERTYLLVAIALSSLVQCYVAENCALDLVNTVSYTGKPSSFTRAGNGQAVNWVVSPSSSVYSQSMNITYYDDKVSPQFMTTYAVNSSELIIFNATAAPQGSMPFSTAGYYTLNYQNPDCMTAAGLIVIVDGPVCTYDSPDPNNDSPGPNNVDLSCSVDYARFINQNSDPIMVWTDSSGKTVDSQPAVSQQMSTDDNLGLYNSVSYCTIAANDAGRYTCNVTFSATQNAPSFVATNAPYFSATCFTMKPALTTAATTKTTNPAKMTTLPPASISRTSSVMTTAVALNCSGQNLTNTVVYGGTPITFKRLSNGQSVQWQVFPSSLFKSPLRNITNYDDFVTAEFIKTYAVSQSELTIFNSTVAPQGSMNYSTAGLYTLNYRNPNCTTAANLIVIDRGPLCACNTSDPNNVTLSCSVDFAESSIQQNLPIFTWKNSTWVGTQQKPNPTLISNYVRRSTSQLPIARGDTTTYECQLTFSSAPLASLNYVTTTPPNFSASCSTSNK